MPTPITTADSLTTAKATRQGDRRPYRGHRYDAKDALAYCGRGVAYGHKNDHDKAIADFTEAIRLDPKDARTYFNRSGDFALKEQYDKAIADLTEAIRLDPRFAQAYAFRGLAYYSKNEFR